MLVLITPIYAPSKISCPTSWDSGRVLPNEAAPSFCYVAHTIDVGSGLRRVLRYLRSRKYSNSFASPLRILSKRPTADYFGHSYAASLKGVRRNIKASFNSITRIGVPEAIKHLEGIQVYQAQMKHQVKDVRSESFK